MEHHRRLIEYQQFLDETEISEKRARELYLSFAENLSCLFAQMGEAVQQMDRDRVQQVLHAMAGLTDGYKVPVLHDEIVGMQMMLRSNHPLSSATFLNQKKQTEQINEQVLKEISHLTQKL
ncbi:hypothetical protein [Anoxynatronum sibiricum]|uniref:HPt domain-containing protein n=1 Tax=Anoxynatronum sibiricum TaxID=210623 RepID=A0ABU9VWN1_9CLOT